MKLRNKKTGEIRDVGIFGDNFLIEARDYPNDTTIVIKSLAELCEEWGDCKKRIVHLEGIQNVFFTPNGRVCIDYTTAKEAEQAVEKLKAWKRLKNNGFKFKGSQLQNLNIKFWLDHGYTEMGDDLDLLFGGKDD